MPERPDIQLDASIGQEYRIPCSHCRTTTRHKVLRSVDLTLTTQDFWCSEEYQIVQCLGCDTVSLRHSWMRDDDFDVDDQGDMEIRVHEDLFPARLPGRSRLEGRHMLPPSVERLYEETYTALCNRQVILAKAGIRSLIEAVCREGNAPGGDLEAMIEGLVTLNDLTPTRAKILHDLRLMGNEIHEAKPSSATELGIAFDIVEHLLRDVFLLKGTAASFDPVLKLMTKAKRREQPVTEAESKAILEGVEDQRQGQVVPQEQVYQSRLGTPPLKKNVGWKVQWAQQAIEDLPSKDACRETLTRVANLAKKGLGALCHFCIERYVIFQFSLKDHVLFLDMDDEADVITILRVLPTVGSATTGLPTEPQAVTLKP